MKNKHFFYIIPLLLILFFGSFFIVKEAKTVFVVQFGKIVRRINQPGLYFKIPLIQGIVAFDKRILQIDSPAKEVIAVDQKRLIVDAFAKYRIVDTEKFFKSLFNEVLAIKKISSILDSSMRQTIAKYPLTALLTDKRNDIMLEIKQDLLLSTQEFGVEIVDVRIIRADLPLKNSDAIFERMIMAREKEAKQLRAEGDEEFVAIKANAEKEAKDITSSAYKQAQIIIGQADAKSAKIYSAAFSKDPEFFDFYKTMDFYKNSMHNINMYISSKSNIFKYIK